MHSIASSSTLRSCSRHYQPLSARRYRRAASCRRIVASQRNGSSELVAATELRSLCDAVVLVRKAVEVGRSSRLDPLLLLSIKDSRDTLDRQLRQLTMASSGQLLIVRDAIDEATNLLMDLDAVLGY